MVLKENNYELQNFAN